jgi:hypothetical protein
VQLIVTGMKVGIIVGGVGVMKEYVQMILFAEK